MDIYREQLEAATQRNKRRKTARFVKGPIPLSWISKAHQLGGKAGPIGLAIWWQAGLTKRRTGLPITSAHAMAFGVGTRRGRHRALDRLEGAGLIKVSRLPNKAPRVDILDAQLKEG